MFQYCSWPMRAMKLMVRGVGTERTVNTQVKVKFWLESDERKRDNLATNRVQSTETELLICYVQQKRGKITHE